MTALSLPNLFPLFDQEIPDVLFFSPPTRTKASFRLFVPRPRLFFLSISRSARENPFSFSLSTQQGPPSPFFYGDQGRLAPTPFLGGIVTLSTPFGCPPGSSRSLSMSPALDHFTHGPLPSSSPMKHRSRYSPAPPLFQLKTSPSSSWRVKCCSFQSPLPSDYSFNSLPFGRGHDPLAWAHARPTQSQPFPSKCDFLKGPMVPWTLPFLAPVEFLPLSKPAFSLSVLETHH